MSRVRSVNIGAPQPNPHKETRATGINKLPQTDAVEVRAPGPKGIGLGSGLVGDYIGDGRHHGGDAQAVYSFTREDLDAWEGRLDRTITDGFFGENLTTEGYDVNEARLGEIWQIGDTVQLKVTSPRLPCSTFRGWVDEKGWLRTFTLAARPGAYLSVVEPGFIRAGDELTVIHRPDHDVTVSLVYRALTTERQLLPGLLAAGDDLDDETREAIEQNAKFDAG